MKWKADAVGALTPTLSHEGDSSLGADRFVEFVLEHLRIAPPAWDPAVGRRGAATPMCEREATYARLRGHVGNA